MFDTIKIAKKIREARIAQNMTQMNLADAMGVSYQAVSNWERGNSMPDISKLEDLCSALKISIVELLGMENQETATVEKIIQTEETVTVEELSSIAPIVSPEEVKEWVEKECGEEKKWNVAALIPIVPYLDEDFLEDIVEEMEVESLLVLQSLAPYLDEDALDMLVRKAPLDDMNGVAALAPFLEEETLDWLVRQCPGKPDKAFLEELVCFLDEETLDYLARRWGGELDKKEMEILAPFLEEESIAFLADLCVQKGDVDGLTALYPFMESCQSADAGGKYRGSQGSRSLFIKGNGHRLSGGRFVCGFFFFPNIFGNGFFIYGGEFLPVPFVAVEGHDGIPGHGLGT